MIVGQPLAPAISGSGAPAADPSTGFGSGRGSGQTRGAVAIELGSFSDGFNSVAISGGRGNATRGVSAIAWQSWERAADPSWGMIQAWALASGRRRSPFSAVPASRAEVRSTVPFPASGAHPGTGLGPAGGSPRLRAGPEARASPGATSPRRLRRVERQGGMRPRGEACARSHGPGRRLPS